MEAAVCLGYNKQAYTDISCKWNKDFLIKIEGNQSINHSFILKKKTINNYNEIKLNKTNKTLRNNVAYYLL